MNIGDYVRTKDGIKKVLKYTYNEKYENGHCVWFDNKDYGILFTDEEINKMKPSPNIIDLLEVGDLIKLKPTKQIQQVLFKNENGIDLTDYVFYDLNNSNVAEEIDWVITHEQIEQMKYKVE